MIRLRVARMEDAAALLAIYSHYVRNTAISFEIESPSLIEFTERIRTITERYPYIVAEQDSMIVGYAYATAFKPRAAYAPSVETTVYLDVNSRGAGLGKYLYTALIDLLRLQGYYTAVAGVTLPNPASEALHRAVGFKPIGIQRNIGFKLGRWHDVEQLQLELLTHSTPPSEPRYWPTLLKVEPERIQRILTRRFTAKL